MRFLTSTGIGVLTAVIACASLSSCSGGSHPSPSSGSGSSRAAAVPQLTFVFGADGFRYRFTSTAAFFSPTGDPNAPRRENSSKSPTVVIASP